MPLDFVYDSTALDFPKINNTPPGPDPTKEVDAIHWNRYGQAMYDLRDAHVAGKYFGFTSQSGDPAPTNANKYFWLRDDDAWILKTPTDGYHVAVSTATAKGDLFVFDGTRFQTLAVGTDGDVLTANSGTGTGFGWTAGGVATSVLSPVSTSPLSIVSQATDIMQPAAVVFNTTTDFSLDGGLFPFIVSAYQFQTAGLPIFDFIRIPDPPVTGGGTALRTYKNGGVPDVLIVFGDGLVQFNKADFSGGVTITGDALGQSGRAWSDIFVNGTSSSFINVGSNTKIDNTKIRSPAFDGPMGSAALLGPNSNGVVIGTSGQPTDIHGSNTTFHEVVTFNGTTNLGAGGAGTSTILAYSAGSTISLGNADLYGNGHKVTGIICGTGSNEAITADRQIFVGPGLSGGGNLGADVTINLNINSFQGISFDNGTGTLGSNGGGDVVGAFDNNSVIKIRGHLLSNSSPADGAILTWNNGGSEWDYVVPTPVTLQIAYTNSGATPTVVLTGSGGPILIQDAVAGPIGHLFVIEPNGGGNPYLEVFPTRTSIASELTTATGVPLVLGATTATRVDIGAVAIPINTIGQLRAIDGNLAAPGVSFTSETDLGMYRIGASQLGFGVDGTNYLKMAYDGLSLGGFTLSAPAGNTLAITDGTVVVGYNGGNGAILLNGSAGFTVPNNTGPRWSGELYPQNDNAQDIGDSSHQVRTIYGKALYNGTTKIDLSAVAAQAIVRGGFVLDRGPATVPYAQWNANGTTYFEIDGYDHASELQWLDNASVDVLLKQTGSHKLTLSDGAAGPAYLEVLGYVIAPKIGPSSGAQHIIPTGTADLVAEDNVRLPPSPSAAGKLVYDTGAAYSLTAAGSTHQLLHGAAGSPTWGAVDLTAEVSGILPTANVLHKQTIQITAGSLAFHIFPGSMNAAFAMDVTGPLTPTIELAADGAPFSVSGTGTNAIVVHYTSGVTTVSQIESLFPVATASGSMRCFAGTGAYVLVDPTDTHAPTALSGGATGNLNAATTHQDFTFTALPAGARLLGFSVGEGPFPGAFSDQYDNSGSAEITIAGGGFVGDVMGVFSVRNSDNPTFPGAGTRGAVGFTCAPFGGTTLSVRFTSTINVNKMAGGGDVDVNIFYLA